VPERPVSESAIESAAAASLVVLAAAVRGELCPASAPPHSMHDTDTLFRSSTANGNPCVLSPSAYPGGLGDHECGWLVPWYKRMLGRLTATVVEVRHNVNRTAMAGGAPVAARQRLMQSRFTSAMMCGIPQAVRAYGCDIAAASSTNFSALWPGEPTWSRFELDGINSPPPLASSACVGEFWQLSDAVWRARFAHACALWAHAAVAAVDHPDPSPEVKLTGTWNAAAAGAAADQDAAVSTVACSHTAPAAEPPEVYPMGGCGCVFTGVTLDGPTVSNRELVWKNEWRIGFTVGAHEDVAGVLRALSCGRTGESPQIQIQTLPAGSPGGIVSVPWAPVRGEMVSDTFVVDVSVKKKNDTIGVIGGMRRAFVMTDACHERWAGYTNAYHDLLYWALPKHLGYAHWAAARDSEQLLWVSGAVRPVPNCADLAQLVRSVVPRVFPRERSSMELGHLYVGVHGDVLDGLRHPHVPAGARALQHGIRTLRDAMSMSGIVPGVPRAALRGRNANIAYGKRAARGRTIELYDASGTAVSTPMESILGKYGIVAVIEPRHGELAKFARVLDAADIFVVGSGAAMSNFVLMAPRSVLVLILGAYIPVIGFTDQFMHLPNEVATLARAFDVHFVVAWDPPSGAFLRDVVWRAPLCYQNPDNVANLADVHILVGTLKEAMAEALALVGTPVGK
jgi:hypothetical protein